MKAAVVGLEQMFNDAAEHLRQADEQVQRNERAAEAARQRRAAAAARVEELSDALMLLAAAEAERDACPLLVCDRDTDHDHDPMPLHATDPGAYAWPGKPQTQKQEA